MHDHIAQTFPDLCAMKDDPEAGPVPQPNPLPRPAGSSKAAAPSPAPQQPETVAKAAGAAAPDLIKAAVTEATAELSAQLAESRDLLSKAMQMLEAQGGALEKHGQVLDAIAGQPDPVSPYRGAVLPQQNKTAMAPAGPSTMASASEQAQSYVYAELYSEWRNSPDATTRLAAERAMEKMRGLPYAS